MIHALAIRRILNHTLPTSCYYTPNLFRSRIPLRNLQFYNFSEQKDRQPKNKQQAWMMQQQKDLKSQRSDQQQPVSYEGYNKIGISAFLILTGSLIYMIYTADQKNRSQLDFFEDSISGMKNLKERESIVGGDWTLTDYEGNPFSSRTLAGYYYLIYFGYTNCPDISPSTLYYISSVYRIIRNLPEGAYLKLKIVFVSIDPERDTPAVVKKYLQNFGKNIIGVTGSSPNDVELRQCMKKFKINSTKVEKSSQVKQNDYLIDNPTRIFLMDPENVYLYHLNLQLSQQQSAKAIIAKIISNQHRKQKLQDQLST